VLLVEANPELFVEAKPVLLLLKPVFPAEKPELLGAPKAGLCCLLKGLLELVNPGLLENPEFGAKPDIFIIGK
jgi:hypothetical protein